MKAVLISIKPKWVEKIASGEKTIEVRKTRPKIETPFKVYIYETQGEYKTGTGIFAYGIELKGTKKGKGKVIGEFVCDSVYEWKYSQLQGLNGTINTYFPIFVEDLLKTCLKHKDLENYGKRKTLYGWHITDLKIYDKPKSLEMFPVGKIARDCGYGNYNIYNKILTRPPQSWCYVEENDGNI